MDLQDILFYIVIGFIGIISYLSQRKAKKQAEEIERRRRQQPEPMPEDVPAMPYPDETPSTTPRYEESAPQEELTLDEIFKALRERKPLTTTRQTQPAATTSRPVTPLQAPTTSEKAPVEENMVHSIKQDTEPITTQTINTEKHNQKRLSINWREAFIASEILNRKY